MDGEGGGAGGGGGGGGARYNRLRLTRRSDSHKLPIRPRGINR